MPEKIIHMHQKIVLKKLKDFNTYVVVDKSGPTIYLLSYCLTNLWLTHLEEHIEWALNPAEWYMSMNISELIKEGDFIFMGSELSDEPDGGPYYKISIQEFLKLLPIWKKLVEANHEFITIADNDGKLEIIGN